MNLGILNQTVILIDTDFLNERISHNLNFYKGLYPDKKFEKINLAELLNNFALNARIEEEGHTVDILFAYTLSNSNLVYCTPSNLTIDISSDGVQMETDIGTFLIRSFFGDEGETCTTHFDNILRIVDNSSRVVRVIVIADNDFLNEQLEFMDYKKKKSLFLIKKCHNTEINVDIKYVNIDYIMADALGLSNNET